MPNGSLKRVPCGDIAVCLARTATGAVYAVQELCSHEEYPLAEEGAVNGDEIECLMHGSTFNLVTGAVTGPPASRPLRTYEVVTENGVIYVLLPESR